MSDQTPPLSFKPPAALLQQLKDSEKELAGMKKIVDALKEIGWDVKELEATYATVSKARDALLKAFG